MPPTSDMILFLIGGGLLGMSQYAWSLHKYPRVVMPPLTAFTAIFLVGALIYGSLFWLIARYFF